LRFSAFRALADRNWNIQPSYTAEASKRREDFLVTRNAALIRVVDRLQFLGRRFVHTTTTRFDVARDFGEN
jgi:hypothetical protein